MAGVVYTGTLVHCLLFGWDSDMVNLPKVNGLPT